MRWSAVLLLVFLALPPADAATEVDWIQVIDDDAGAHPLSMVPYMVDPRADIRTVHVADLGDRVGLRLATAAAADAAGPATTIHTELEFSLHSGWLGSWTVIVAATDATFNVTATQRDVTWTLPAHSYVLDADAVAWAYEIHLDRNALREDGLYLRGDEVNYFEARARAEGSGFPVQIDAASQTEWGQEVQLLGSGGHPLETFSSTTDVPWYPYNVRADATGMAVAAQGGDLHMAFHLIDDSRTYARQGAPLGIYHVHLDGGHLVESFVTPAEPPVIDSYGPHDTQVALALQGGAPHILFHPEPSDGTAGASGLVHAWLEGDAWRTEQPLSDLGVGSIMVDHRSVLEAAATDGRLVVGVRHADDSGLTLIEKRAGAWRILEEIPGAAFARLEFDAAGGLHIATYHQDPDRETGRRSFSELRYHLEGEEPRRLLIGLEDNNEHGRTAATSGSFDMAVRADGVACFFYWSLYEDVPVGYRCGDEVDALPFLAQAGAPLEIVRLALGPDGSVHVQAGYGGLDWYGHRSPDGQWWWETQAGHQHPDLALLADGRAVQVYGQNGGYGGLTIAVEHPDHRDDVTLAFFVGTADESANALAQYREPPSTGSEPAGQTMQPVRAQPSQQPSPTEAQSTPVPAVLLLVALLVAARRP